VCFAGIGWMGGIDGLVQFSYLNEKEKGEKRNKEIIYTNSMYYPN
jgi:hypothetical protein